MAENLDKDIETKIDDMVTDDCLDEDLITISRRRYSRLYQERDRFLRRGRLMLILFVLILIILISCIATVTNTITQIATDNNKLKENYRYQVEKLMEQVLSQSASLEERDNEISQLRDRIGFLSLASATMYREEPNKEIEEKNINEVIIEDWRNYVNLFTIGQNVPLPIGIDTNTFRCMDYRTITDTTSWQYKIQELSTTSSNGLRVYNYKGRDYYTVALATAYGIDLGNAYEVEFENGTIFYIVHAEYKHDIRYPRADDYGDPDVNYDEENTISVIEFVYDWQSAPQRLIDDGEANRFLGENCDIYGNGCNIKRMTYLGKIWNAI